MGQRDYFSRKKAVASVAAAARGKRQEVMKIYYILFAKPTSSIINLGERIHLSAEEIGLLCVSSSKTLMKISEDR